VYRYNSGNRRGRSRNRIENGHIFNTTSKLIEASVIVDSSLPQPCLYIDGLCMHARLFVETVLYVFERRQEHKAAGGAFKHI
jgi:hypothetical protein